MGALTKESLPSKWATVPFYVVGALVFFLVSLLCLLSVPEFMGHYFQPKVLAITHLAVLGWATMVLIGASNQQIPIITEQKLYSEKLPILILILLTSGAGILSFCFWFFLLNWLAYMAGGLVFTALVLHAFNILQTAKHANDNVVNNTVTIAHVWLIFAALLGLTLFINLRMPFLPMDHLLYLKVHAGIGMAGWFLQLIIGLSSRLVPMIFLSEKEETNWLQATYYSLNVGLVLFLVNGMLLQSNELQLLSISLLLISILSYARYLYGCYQSAQNKKMDEGFKQTFIAMLPICLPISLLVITYIVKGDPSPRLITALGFSFLGGSVSILIMAQTFKTLPFIVSAYNHTGGTLPGTMPKDLFKEQWMKGHLLLYLSGFLLFLTGIILHLPFMLYLGASLMTGAAGWYLLHVLLVINKLNRNS